MKEIWQFLSVILAGVIAALLLVVWMVRGGISRDERIYTYQALLSPATIETMSNRAIRIDKSEGSASYLIESIRFAYVNQETKKWEERSVDISGYTKFFNSIEGDRGVLNPSDELFGSFQGNLPKLTFFVKQRSAGSADSSVTAFQTLEFNSTGNAYRVDLHLDQSKKEWVYFSHAGVFSLAMEILEK